MPQTQQKRKPNTGVYEVIDGKDVKFDAKAIPKHVAHGLSHPLVRIIADYFKDTQHQKEYEEWHLKQYGRLPEGANGIANKKNKKGAKRNEK